MFPKDFDAYLRLLGNWSFRCVEEEEALREDLSEMEDRAAV
jgi:hypothetical protein